MLDDNLNEKNFAKIVYIVGEITENIRELLRVQRESHATVDKLSITVATMQSNTNSRLKSLERIIWPIVIAALTSIVGMIFIINGLSNKQ